MTRIGAPFDASQNHPIVEFAAFYVTGWTGAAAAGCGNDTIPPATAALGNEIWGHIVKFVEPPSQGAPASAPCDTQGIAACIATLVQ